MGPESLGTGAQNTDRIRIYENKIRLMTQQIDGLKKDMAVKVKLDQRKLRYAREQLAQFNDKMYGRGEQDQFQDTGYPGLRNAVEAVPVEDLPNFPSPYASQ